MNSEAINLRTAAKKTNDEIIKEIIDSGNKNEFDFIRQVWEPNETSTSASVESSLSAGYVKKIKIGTYINKFLDSQLQPQVYYKLKELY
ncbi:unnamed protein product [Paramecium sonneborni]|uniref:Uncharacterized protein n=1 Tax=Paramecium sonneborni TaxID=65129 RepID=A0A8S1MH70_9CILI|nr:unnamed protein product [Paramecium sonneborni]